MTREHQTFECLSVDSRVHEHEGFRRTARMARERGEHAQIRAMAQMQEWRKAWYPVAGLAK